MFATNVAPTTIPAPKEMTAPIRIAAFDVWFTLRRGYFVLEAESIEELTRKTAAFFFIWKTDPVISPAISMEEFGKVIGILGEEGKKYQS